jgi:hypothetical protein
VTGRVADMSLSQNAIQSLQASLSRVADLQNEASSGKKLTKRSDSPVDIGTSLQLRASLNPATPSWRQTSPMPRRGSERPAPRSVRS